MRFFLLILFAFGSIQAGTSPSAPVQSEHDAVVQTIRYQDQKRGRPVLIELWSPPASGDKKYPLIVFSHGHGGDRRNLSWLAENLAQNGFVVASVEHHGNSLKSYNPVISLRFWERARDISFVIQELLKDQKQIDATRIGFVGYSLGGMTGLSLAGARAQNVKEIVKQQQARLKEIHPEMIEQTDFAEAHSNFAEPRIKSMVLISPATFVFPPQSLKNLKVPVALVATEGDEVLPFQDHAKKLISHLVPAKLKLFRDQSHYVFVNPVREGSQADAIEPEQAAVQKEVGEFTLVFFQETLK